ncbi:biosynthetic peptidoglycan transglycosylase [Pseudobacteriovorax antillogorgiicola]|uniref:Monofunctional biosynthetic peptidoglycan transglycosylase n=1 Tax=Pseudobacteriovorax antillogorgiicola TaxID=1513793 RepID=A0A1Y6BNY4_9BACT|nr:biosynthetic peptidoglycan transglycosylase [Pseudobacteriovorax antillogorgiicola]TCS55416.1 monofunctional biosynthetic peptidoglycan transglycosylase [Pseudobacteriovorax antillogorgiicola]SMF12642.1 monofunctional biosynthetic peptidoglycan transglycosylase [Pseudobacteriovorax antillogorgiicola]
MSRFAKIFLVIISSITLLDIAYLASIWPAWEDLAQGPIPESTFIKQYRDHRRENPDLPPLRWTPSQESLSKELTMPFIIAEDSRFYNHLGVDIEALADAVEYNLKRKKLALGASTISQQTVKNLFLSSSRSLLRKWHELILTAAMETHLSKKRILQIYLNIAEFGHGIFGIHAASLYYFYKSPSALTTEELVSLAASLPSPKKHNPQTQTEAFEKRKTRILSVIKKYHQNLLSPPAIEDGFDLELMDPIEADLDEPESEATDHETDLSNENVAKDLPN